MSRDTRSGSDPEFAMSPEDEAFLRLVEDSYEAAGRPTDTAGADRVWNKLETRLGPDVPQDSNVRSIQSAKSRSRKRWSYVSGAIGVAAALVLFVNFQQKADSPTDTMQTRGGAETAGFKAEIKVYESAGRHVRVKVLAAADGHIALFRQQGEGAPIFVSNLVYQKDQGETMMLEEESQAGTRYCIVGDKNQEGLKHLVDLIPELWSYLPSDSCYSVR